MSLNENAQTDTGQVEDRRSEGGRRGGMFPIGGGGRGGIIGLIATVILLLGGGYGSSQLIGGDNGSGGDNTNLTQECATSNPNRLQNLDCRNTSYINSIQNFWKTELPQVTGTPYEPATTVFFSQQTDTGCGSAGTGVGPSTARRTSWSTST